MIKNPDVVMWAEDIKGWDVISIGGGRSNKYAPMQIKQDYLSVKIDLMQDSKV